MQTYEELYHESIGPYTIIACQNEPEGFSVDVYEDGPCDAMLISSEDCLEKDLEELFRSTVNAVAVVGAI